MGGPKRQSEKKRSTSEKHVSISVLQQYFSGSLKDAAKSIGGESSLHISFQTKLSYYLCAGYVSEKLFIGNCYDH